MYFHVRDSHKRVYFRSLRLPGDQILVGKFPMLSLKVGSFTENFVSTRIFVCLFFVLFLFVCLFVYLFVCLFVCFFVFEAIIFMLQITFVIQTLPSDKNEWQNNESGIIYGQQQHFYHFCQISSVHIEYVVLNWK